MKKKEAMRIVPLLQKKGLVSPAAKNLILWLTDPLFQEFYPELLDQVKKENIHELNDAFYQLIPFGTGGRRGKMGIGPNRINTYTIGSSAQGYAAYLMKHFGERVVKRRGVVITYDVRHHSEEFARAAASVFAANGIKVYFFDGVRSTPQISFTVRYTHAVGGAMISASHNPPCDNGIKIYWETGGMVIPPHDFRIIRAVNAVKKIHSGDFDTFLKKGKIVMMDSRVDDAYHEAVMKRSLGKERDVKIVFTPLHGVATTSFLPVLRRIGFKKITELKSQMPEDGDFSHVENHIPNPEVPQSLTKAIKEAKKIGADLVLASDPDADRIGVVSRKSLAGQQYIFLNGNQIGVLLLSYITRARKVKSGACIKTVVTTDLLKKIALAHEMHVIDGLPVGFKYIADAIENHLGGREFIFGAEESHGYLYGDYARDKDGAVAALLISEYAAKLKKEGRTLYEELEHIKKEYGYYRELLQAVYYHGMDGMEKMLGIMESMRKKMPKKIGPCTVEEMVDQWTKKIIDGHSGRVRARYTGFIDNALIFYLDKEKNIRVVVRPSGTEPKIKFYSAVGVETGKDISWKEYEKRKKKADRLVAEILESIVSTAEKYAPGGERFQVLG